MSVLHLVIRQCMLEQRDKVLEGLVTYRIYLPELLPILHDLLFYAFRNRNETLRTEVTRLNDYFQVISPKMVTLIRDDPHKAHEIISKVRQVFQSQRITTAYLQGQVEKGWTPAFLCLCCIVLGEGDAATWEPIAGQCTTSFQEVIPSICAYFRRLCSTSLASKAKDIQWRMTALMLGDEQPWDTLSRFIADEPFQYTHSVAVDSVSSESESKSDTKSDSDSGSGSGSDGGGGGDESSSPLDSHSSVSLEA